MWVLLYIQFLEHLRTKLYTKPKVCFVCNIHTLAHHGASWQRSYFYHGRVAGNTKEECRLHVSIYTKFQKMHTNLQWQKQIRDWWGQGQKEGEIVQGQMKLSEVTKMFAVLISWVCVCVCVHACVQTYQIVHFKCVKFIIYKIYLKKA
jgi:hypothetical protein